MANARNLHLETSVAEKSDEEVYAYVRWLLLQYTRLRGRNEGLEVPPKVDLKRNLPRSILLPRTTISTLLS
jgi:hypothetical protein